MVIPLLISLIVALAISPVVDWLRKRGTPSGLAIWIALLAGALVFGGIVTLLIFANLVPRSLTAWVREAQCKEAPSQHNQGLLLSELSRRIGSARKE